MQKGSAIYRMTGVVSSCTSCADICFTSQDVGELAFALGSANVSAECN